MLLNKWPEAEVSPNTYNIKYLQEIAKLFYTNPSRAVLT